MGGWSHPDISLEDLMKLVKGFVDILILASGYLSSGRFANWDPQNIKKAFQWGLFFENLLGNLDDYQDCTEELDAALSELASNPYFPQGLKHLSSATLGRGRIFILEHLIHTVPLRDQHMKAFVEAVIEMDLDELQKTENNCIHVYLDMLNLQIAASNPRKGIMVDSPCTSQDNVVRNSVDGDFTITMSAIQEIMRRDVAASCISSAELGLSSLSKIASHCSQRELDGRLIPDQLKQATALVPEECLIDSFSWRTRNLSYLLDKRTIRLVSGADMIFSAPKVQWVQIFERLNMSGKKDDDLLETIELLLLGLISSRWSPLLEHFTLICNDMNNSLTIYTIYHEVHTLLLERYKNFPSKEEMKSSKEQGILEYLEVLLSHQLHQLWKLSPILVAMSLPSWSQLFRWYFNELGGRLKGKSLANRCCSCNADSHEHRDCEVAERIWCIYIFHVHGSHLMLGTNLA